MNSNKTKRIYSWKQALLKFLDRETVSGLLLIAATFISLWLANSSFSGTFEYILENEFVIGLQNHFSVDLTLEGWINDGLMVIFFLVAGLEIKRELVAGELSHLNNAIMPLLAATGGMVVPALIFLYFNHGEPTIDGWGIPMATDIAYSLGIIGLLGKRIPYRLKMFLIEVAVIDDIGAILVIAVFYSSHIVWSQIALAGVVFVALMLLNYFGVKSLRYYVILGVCLWLCFLHSGIHPTIAGVLLASTIPYKPALGSKAYKKRIHEQVEELEETDIESGGPMRDRKQRQILHNIRKVTNLSRPPLVRLDNTIVGFNAFIIIPLFALANANVTITQGISETLTSPLGMGILFGLLVGKVFGISFFSYLGSKLNIARLPTGLNWLHIIGVGLLAGIGFTMSLFISHLAFGGTEYIQTSKLSILAASLVAALLGLGVLRLSSRS